MALPASLSRKLRDTLGQDAGGDLVTWLEEERAEREQIRADLQLMEKRLITALGEVKSDLMKWSFVFWVGAVTAIAALAGVLR